MKADLNGSRLDFYVNGVKELTATESAMSTGKRGLTNYKVVYRTVARIKRRSLVGMHHHLGRNQ